MASGESEGGHSSRRRRYEDDDIDYDRRQRAGRRGDSDAARSKRRDRSRHRDKDSEHGRSRSPDPRDHLSRSWERESSERGRYPDRSVDKNRQTRRVVGEEADAEDARDLHGDKRRRRSQVGHSPGSKRKSRFAENFGRSDDKQSLVQQRGPLPSQDDSFAVSTGLEPEKPVEKPNFGTSGLLAAASNSVTQADGSTVTLKYHEPPEARKPPARDQWKLFIFKGSEIIDTVELSLRSCWLIGRDTAVVDLPAEHPSISKQHAVIQFRYTEKHNDFGDKVGKVKPYLIDLESANGTILNGDKVPESRYLELRNKDMLQFGQSTREYVLMLPPRH